MGSKLVWLCGCEGFQITYAARSTKDGSQSLVSSGDPPAWQSGAALRISLPQHAAQSVSVHVALKLFSGSRVLIFLMLLVLFRHLPCWARCGCCRAFWIQLRRLACPSFLRSDSAALAGGSQDKQARTETAWADLPLCWLHWGL